MILIHGPLMTAQLLRLLNRPLFFRFEIALRQARHCPD